jgi:hypothetical protein
MQMQAMVEEWLVQTAQTEMIDVTSPVSKLDQHHCESRAH